MKTLKINDHSSYKLSETEVIKRILSGEKELYEILLRRNNQTLYRVIRGYIKDHNEVQDIMQNSYLKAYEKLDQFKFTSAFSTWLIRIAINESLARLKEKAKVYHLNHQNQDEAHKTIMEMPDRNQLNPEKKYLRQEARQIMEKAIDVLEPKYRSVYIMKEIEDLSMQEISECLDISIANVKVRLHRAKNLLKESLYDLTHNQDIFEFGSKQCEILTEKVMRKIL